MISSLCVTIFCLIENPFKFCRQRVIYEPHHDLEAAIASTGHSYKDIKVVIIGHLHVDHGGGLALFVRISKSYLP
jgi:glyoxylase-like metal-dependent hydrolase (beta-lactamase superfamily II)